ncbi:MAG: hypothetical protein UZ19_OD1000846 [Parcubacteria bacterium OLB19]|nr:MAG: hypothetical protein UZ19_OD1000846 [Parcubacteria bacterium OLB19]
MTLRNMIKWVISPVVFFLLGISVGAPIWLRQLEWLTWDQLDLSNILSIISIAVNTIIAIIIVIVLQRIQDIRRVEKNILIERVGEEVKGIKAFVVNCCNEKSTDFSSITSFFKTANIRISKITSTHSNCENESNLLIEGVTTLNSLLTDPKGTQDLTIDKNKVSLKPKRIQEVNIQMAEVENRSLDLIVCINRQASKH